MTITLQEFNKNRTRTDLTYVKPGDIVKVHQKIMEIKEVGKKKEAKERIQIFEGLVIGRKGGKGMSAAITVRKISAGIGVERIFPINSPGVEKIELIKKTKTRRAKLNYMRDRIGKATQLKGEFVKQEEKKEAKSEKAVDTNKNDGIQKEETRQTRDTETAKDTKTEQPKTEKSKTEETIKTGEEKKEKTETK